MSVWKRLRRLALSAGLLAGIACPPAHAAPLGAETALAEFTVTVYLEETAAYAGAELSVELSDGLAYAGHEVDPRFTGLYQYNGVRHLIGGMTTTGENAFAGKLKFAVLTLRYDGDAGETIAVTPSVSRYDGSARPATRAGQTQTIGIARPAPAAGAGDIAGTGGGAVVLLDERNPNLELVIRADGTASLGSTDAGYADIAGHWAEPYIVSLSAQRYVAGVGGGLFLPNARLTRAEFVQMFYNAFGSGEQSGRPPAFADTAPGRWYADAVAWAAESGLVTGYDSAAFGPNDPIRRQDMTVVMARLAAAFAVDLPASRATAPFADDAAIGGYARDAVYRMQAAAIVDGKGNGLFDPLGYATRAEAAKIFYYMLDHAGKIDPAYAVR